jgi:G:T-mismatch repair DNA endonuclease (very short patch repair protein)
MKRNQLEALGWRVLEIRECELDDDIGAVIARLRRLLRR